MPGELLFLLRRKSIDRQRSVAFLPKPLRAQDTAPNHTQAGVPGCHTLRQSKHTFSSWGLSAVLAPEGLNSRPQAMLQPHAVQTMAKPPRVQCCVISIVRRCGQQVRYGADTHPIMLWNACYAAKRSAAVCSILTSECDWPCAKLDALALRSWIAVLIERSVDSWEQGSMLLAFSGYRGA